MMMGLPVAALAFLVWRLAREVRDPSETELRLTLGALAGERQRAAATTPVPGALEPAAPAAVRTSLALVREALLIARRAGLPLQGALSALAEAVHESLATARHRRRLATLVSARFAVSFALALGGRLFLLSRHVAIPVAHARLDRIALGLGSSLAVAALWALLGALPRPWLWAEGLSPRGRSWLTTRLTLEVTPGCPDREAIERLRVSELVGGVSLRREKGMALEAWARAQSSAERDRLAAIEELLPLVEILGLGVACLLLVAFPCLAGLESP